MSFLIRIKPGAIRGWREEGILASVIGAQAALEGGWGTSKLAKPPYNNHFGIKASSDWTGKVINMPTLEFINGAQVSVNADFRWYDSEEESLLDHARFFTNTPWRTENYKAVVGETDYKKAAWALQNAPAPYATDPGYAQKLINIIEQNNLQAWDVEAMSETTTDTVATPVVQTARSKMVGAELTSAGQEYVKNLPVTVIGDSLGVGTRSHLQLLIATANFDVMGSRQLTHATTSLDATKALQSMKNAGTLKEYVVVIIGTNRGVTEQEINNFVAIAGAERKVIFVDTASEVAHANAVSIFYSDAAKRLSNVFYVNWHLHATPKLAEYYSKDGANGEYIHMTSTGYKKHAEFIAQALYEVATGDFTERTAVTPKVDYYNIETLELKPDGIVTYDAWKVNADGTSTKYKATRQTEIKGLFSPYGDTSIYNPEANQQQGFGGSVNNSNWLEARYTNTEETDMFKLLHEASVELIDRSTPDMQYTVSLMEMPDTISIGDTGIFVDHDFQPPLYIRARIISISVSRTNPRLNRVILGNVIELHPQKKDQLMTMRDELAVTRDELRNEWVNSERIVAEIITTNGPVLGDKFAETDLMARVLKNGVNITDQFDSFKWQRISGDEASDAAFNQLMESTTQSSVLAVVAKDIIGNQSQFVARAYNAKNELVHTSEIVLKRVETALWVDTDTPPEDAKDGATWTKTDGTQMVKVNNEWEERVDQRVASEIVNRDGVTVSFSDVEPSNGGKQNDVWFKLNSDGSQSIMRHDGTEWFETVTNALNADGIIEGTMDFSVVNAININASSITAGHGDFLSLALTALNSKATLDGAALRFTNDENGFIEMNSVPEIRSTAPDGTSVLLNSGRLHFYDSMGISKGYFGTDIHDGTRDFGTFLSNGSGTYRFARMAEAQSTVAKYYTVEPGDQRVAVITKLVQRGELPDGDGADFVRKSNMIAKLNGWPALPQEWSNLVTGQQIKYQEEAITGGGTTEVPQYYTVISGDSWWGIASKNGVPLQELYDLNNADASTVIHAGDQILIGYETVAGGGNAYDDIWKVGPSSQGDFRVYFLKHARFEGGFTDVSDRRIKYDIEPTAIKALENIDALDFKGYKMQSDDREVDLGIIAQEAGILRVADDELEGIDIQKAVMLSLKGVQELHAMVKEQATEIDRLKKLIEKEETNGL